MDAYYSNLLEREYGISRYDRPSGKLTGGSKSVNLGSQNVITTFDKNLLIDLSKLSIKNVICQSRYFVVHQGLYKSRPVAIKVIQPARASNVSPVRKKKFEREITLLSRVKHENIVKFIGASMEPTLILVMELVKGDTLEKYLWSIRPHCPDLKLSLSFAFEISKAMEYLHAMGIIHRNLKPSNLLLTEDGTKIRLADFGLAREETEAEMTMGTGTFRWMAPELIDIEAINDGVKKHYNHKVDVYSFSMVLWELLTNNTPFKGSSSIMAAYATAKKERPSTDDIPKEIKPLITNCWSEDPADRPEFEKISKFLANHLGVEYTPEAINPNPSVMQPEITDISGTSKKKKKKSKGLLCCFST